MDDIALIQSIARIRRAMPYNKEVMELMDELERRLGVHLAGKVALAAFDEGRADRKRLSNAERQKRYRERKRAQEE